MLSIYMYIHFSQPTQYTERCHWTHTYLYETMVPIRTSVCMDPSSRSTSSSRLTCRLISVDAIFRWEFYSLTKMMFLGGLSSTVQNWFRFLSSHNRKLGSTSWRCNNISNTCIQHKLTPVEKFHWIEGCANITSNSPSIQDKNRYRILSPENTPCLWTDELGKTNDRFRELSTSTILSMASVRATVPKHDSLRQYNAKT